jgi:hypothetical protein
LSGPDARTAALNIEIRMTNLSPVENLPVFCRAMFVVAPVTDTMAPHQQKTTFWKQSLNKISTR